VADNPLAGHLDRLVSSPASVARVVGRRWLAWNVVLSGLEPWRGRRWRRLRQLHRRRLIRDWGCWGRLSAAYSGGAACAGGAACTGGAARDAAAVVFASASTASAHRGQRERRPQHYDDDEFAQVTR
jgi:hypothetical protein